MAADASITSTLWKWSAYNLHVYNFGLDLWMTSFDNIQFRRIMRASTRSTMIDVRFSDPVWTLPHLQYIYSRRPWNILTYVWTISVKLCIVVDWKRLTFRGQRRNGSLSEFQKTSVANIKNASICGKCKITSNKALGLKW